MKERNQTKCELPVLIVGTGPAGLMAAHVLTQAGRRVLIAEKRKAAGRKLLVAGSSGLNVTFDCPHSEFVAQYTAPQGRFDSLLRKFSPSDWLRFIESLGIGTFKGTSRRFFVEGMKAPQLLRNWLEAIRKKGGEFLFQHELIDFEVGPAGVHARFSNGVDLQVSALYLALGGGSWEKDEVPLRWPHFFKEKGLGFTEFSSSNCGFQVAWPPLFLEEAEGAALKNVLLTSSRGARRGELVVTRYGLEGTPVYFAGEVGKVKLDLKPDLTVEQIRQKLAAVRENFSPIRRMKKTLNLSDSALALLFHLIPKSVLADSEALIQHLKNFPLELKGRQPLEEAISSSGGVSWDEVDDSFMLKKFPGVFLAGEMLEWDAPTGGFLIQGCVSQGYVAAQEILKYLKTKLFG